MFLPFQRNSSSFSDRLYPRTDTSKVGIIYTVEPSEYIRTGLQVYLDAANYPGTGTTWSDLSGNGRNYTLVNSPTYNSANGGSLLFQTNQYSDGPASNSFNIDQNVTIELVYKLNTSSGTQWGFFFDTSAADRGISTHLNEGGSTIFDTMGYNTGNGDRISVGAVSNGTITHLTCRYRNNTTPRKNIFRNGSSVADSGANTPTALSLSSGVAQVPGNKYGIYIDANIYLFRVYNIALTDEQILFNFNVTKTRFGL